MCLSHRPLCNSQVRARLFIVQSTSLRRLADVCSAIFAPAMPTRHNLMDLNKALLLIFIYKFHHICGIVPNRVTSGSGGIHLRQGCANCGPRSVNVSHVFLKCFIKSMSQIERFEQNTLYKENSL